MTSDPDPSPTPPGAGAGPAALPPWCHLPEAARKELIPCLEPVPLRQGESLVHAGEPLTRLFWLHLGSWVAEPPPGTAVVPTPLALHTLVGEGDLLEGAPWPLGIRAAADGLALALPLERLRHLALDHPEALSPLPNCTRLLAQQGRLLQVLGESPAFHGLPPRLLRDLAAHMTWRVHAGGERVFSRGEPSTTLLLVINGRLQAVTPEAGGEPRLLGEIGRGESVGEVGLILDEPRSTDVRAARDTTVAVLTRQGLESLLERHPVVFNRLLSRFIMHHFGPRERQRPRRRPLGTLAVLPLGPDTPGREVARQLVRALSEHGSALLVDPEVAGGDPHRPAGGDREGELGLIERLNDLESRYDHLVYAADGSLTPWTRRCLRQADHLVLVGDGGGDPTPGELEHALEELPEARCKQRSLLLLTPGPVPGRTRQWLTGRQVRAHYHLRPGVAGDFARLARLLTGRAVGLVLGGGGARGFAHLGVIRALQEAGIPIDAVGGNSMGALLGAQFALGRPLEEILERTIALCLGGEAFTLPLVSFLSGRRMARGMGELLGQADLEDLPTPFFCVSCNLSRARVMVHDRGPLRDAVLASNSPAGLLPPRVHGTDLLVDGGLLNNVPVDVMRRLHVCDRLIAVDVNTREELFAQEGYRDGLSGWGLLARRLNPFRPNPAFPHIGAILARAGIIGGLAQRERSREADSDWELLPPVSQFPLMAYWRGGEIAEAGYRYARERLQSGPPPVPPTGPEPSR